MAPKHYQHPNQKGPRGPEVEALQLDIPAELTPGVDIANQKPGDATLDIYDQEQGVVRELGSHALPHWTERPVEPKPEGFDAFSPQHKKF